MTLFSFLSGIAIAFGVAAVVAWAIESRRRRRHAVTSGFHAEISLPFEEPFELYHNALSLCSMKTRLCMAELQIPYKSHAIDLIETGAYENIRAPFLRVNPAGTVPVLVHEGHPIYESHEQIRYAARFAASENLRLVPEDPVLKAEMDEWIDRSSLTEDPINHGELSAGNAVPGQTLPLFAGMVEDVPLWKIFEGLLFHFDKIRPALFIILKIRGLGKIDRMPPIASVIGRSRREMHGHLDALEEKLLKSGGPWILGETYSLADVSWLVIFERLRQVDAVGVFMGNGFRPAIEDYWARLRARPAYREAILDQSHPFIEAGRKRIIEAKAASEEIRCCLEGRREGNLINEDS